MLDHSLLLTISCLPCLDVLVIGGGGGGSRVILGLVSAVLLVTCHNCYTELVQLEILLLTDDLYVHFAIKS